jgi:erythromycin esterase-like protein
MIDRYVRHKPARQDRSEAFQRFPTWMWRNQEVDDFVRWMRAHNAKLPAQERAGFFGLDIYNMNASIRAVIDYLDKRDPEAARVARERYGCLTPWQHDPATYGRAVLTSGYSKCEARVAAMLRDVFAKEMEYRAMDEEDFLDAAQNAKLVAAADRREILPGDVSRRGGVVESARPSHVLDARGAARMARRRLQGRGLGA